MKLLLKVIPPGFEPGTHSLEGCCSIQLSYETNSTGLNLVLINRLQIYNFLVYYLQKILEFTSMVFKLQEINDFTFCFLW